MERSFLSESRARPSASHLGYWMLVALLLAAAVLRFVALVDFPPGIAHDEVAEMLIAEDILAGGHAIYFRDAFGQEPLFLYLVAGARVLLGRNVLALRFVSASVGLLTVAAGIRWSRRLFGMRVAIITAAGLGVMLWPVFWSRVGLRGMLLPLTMLLGADALWAALTTSRPYRQALLGGLWLGLSAYTYLAARGIPFFLLGMVLLLALFDGARLRRRWRALLLVCVLAALIALPLVVHLAWNKDAQFRVYEVDGPLRALRAGDVRPVLENAPRILGMATVQGDPTERNNLPLRPVFAEPVWAFLFYLGLGVVLGRFRDVRYSLLVAWLVAMLAPSWVTTEAPNFVRTLGALPAVMVLPALGAEYAWQRLGRWGKRWATLGAGVVAGAVLINAVLTAQVYFLKWAEIPEVGFVWQTGLREVAAWLDTQVEVESVTMGGLSATTMDSMSLDMMMQRADIAVRWCEPGSPLGTGGGLVIPEGGGLLLLPAFVPLNPELAAYVGGKPAEPRLTVSFQVVELDAAPRLEGNNIPFQGQATFIALTDAEGGDRPLARAGESLTLFSVWEAVGDDAPDLKSFVHVLDRDGVLRAQHDGLDCPAPFWRTGDRIVQRHIVQLPADFAPGRYSLSVGLYNRETLMPYMRLDGQPTYEAGTLEIILP